MKLSRRKPKTINKTARRKTETPNNEESLDPPTNSNQSVSQNQSAHNHAVEESATDTENHGSEYGDSEDADDDNEDHDNDGKEDENSSIAASHATSQSSSKKGKHEGSPNPASSPRLRQLGCGELFSGENATVIGLGPDKAYRKAQLRALCRKLLELRLGNVFATILQPDSFVAVHFDNDKAKDYALRFLRKTLSSTAKMTHSTDEHDASEAESSADSSEAVGDKHQGGGRRADGHFNYGNLRVRSEDSALTERVQKTLNELADFATALRELERENGIPRAMLIVHGMNPEKIAECLELIREGVDVQVAIFAVG